MASWASSSRPSPFSACRPMIRQLPVRPASTPNSLRKLTGSWRVIANVSSKVKIGEGELRMVARPASPVSFAQEIRQKGERKGGGVGRRGEERVETGGARNSKKK